MRKFAGNTAQTQTQNGKPSLPEVRTHYDVANGNVFLKFTNKNYAPSNTPVRTGLVPVTRPSGAPAVTKRIARRI